MSREDGVWSFQGGGGSGSHTFIHQSGAHATWEALGMFL